MDWMDMEWFNSWPSIRLYTFRFPSKNGEGLNTTCNERTLVIFAIFSPSNATHIFDRYTVTAWCVVYLDVRCCVCVKSFMNIRHTLNTRVAPLAHIQHTHTPHTHAYTLTSSHARDSGRMTCDAAATAAQLPPPWARQTRDDAALRCWVVCTHLRQQHQHTRRRA